MSGLQVFGDWRDLRGAIERAAPEWEGSDEATRKQLWDFAAAVVDEYAPAKAECLNCKAVIPARSAFRCADCRSHLCETCIVPHFGPNHRRHS